MTAGLLHRAIVGSLRVLPRPLIEYFARAYVAGTELDDALFVVERLARTNRTATIDVLGEAYTSVGQVRNLVDEYRRILDSPSATDPSPTLSLMMTGLGLRIDAEFCWNNLVEIAAAAAERGRSLTINMEDSTTTDATLDAYVRLRREGFDHVGIVLQAALRRTLDDVLALAPFVPRVRVVKGIWAEPYAVAHNQFDVIRTNYARILARLIEVGSYVEVATHDEWLVEEALARLRGAGRSTDEYEFQMLLGVRPELGDRLLEQGHPVRVYVPYGKNWYEYCLRRLKESPDVARHAIAAGIRRVLRQA